MPNDKQSNSSLRDALQWALQMKQDTTQQSHDSLMNQVQAAPRRAVMDGVQASALIDLEKSVQGGRVIFESSTDRKDK